MSRNKRIPSNTYLLPILDFIFLVCLFVVQLAIKYKGIGLSVYAFLQIVYSFYKNFLLIIISWFLLSGYTKLYLKSNFTGFITVFKRIIIQIIAFYLLFLAISNDQEDKAQFIHVWSFLSLFSFLIVSRLLFIQFLRILRQNKNLLENVIIIGYNDNVESLIGLMNNQKKYGFNLQNVFVPTDLTLSHSTFSDIQALEKYLTKCKNIDSAYISLEGNEVNDDISKLINLLEKNYIKISFIPNTYFELKQQLSINYLDTFPILSYRKYPLDHIINQITKRTFDIVFTLFAFVILLWWLLPILSVAVYFSQGKPIFFAQKRNGLNGREFDCLKFRTMRPDKSNDIKPTERDDPRVTKLGKILRKTSLDELPQFFNVLKGDMSIVGPRPHMVSENETYSEIIKRYSLRHYVKPGITGLAQVRGYRGAVDSDKDMEMRIRTDIYYVRNWSFLLDIYIIYKTVRLMIVGDENAI